MDVVGPIEAGLDLRPGLFKEPVDRSAANPHVSGRFRYIAAILAKDSLYVLTFEGLHPDFTGFFVGEIIP